MATSKASKPAKKTAAAAKSQSRRSKTYELKTAGAISSVAKTPTAKRTQTKSKAAPVATKKPVAAKKKAAPTTKVKAAVSTRAKRSSTPTKAAETKRLQSYVKQISREIDQVGRKAQKAVAATEKEYNKQLRDLKRKHASVEKKLGTLAGKGDDAFHEMKKGFESAAKEAANAVKKAARQFR